MPLTWYGMVCAVCYGPIEHFEDAVIMGDDLLDIHPGLCAKFAGIPVVHTKWDNESRENDG